MATDAERRGLEWQERRQAWWPEARSPSPRPRHRYRLSRCCGGSSCWSCRQNHGNRHQPGHAGVDETPPRWGRPSRPAGSHSLASGPRRSWHSFN